MHTNLLALSLLVTSAVAVRPDFHHDELWARDLDSHTDSFPLTARDILDLDDASLLLARNAEPQNGAAAAAAAAVSAARTAAAAKAAQVAGAAMAFMRRPSRRSIDEDAGHYDFALYARDAARGGGRGGRVGGTVNTVNSVAGAGVNAANAYSTIRGAFSGRDALGEDVAGYDFDLFARDYDDEDVVLMARDAARGGGRGGRGGGVGGAVNTVNSVAGAGVNAANAYSTIRGAFSGRDTLGEDVAGDDFDLFVRGLDFEDGLDLVERSVGEDDFDFDFEMY